MIATMCGAKGGAGKSAFSLHLAAEAMQRGLRVFLADADPLGVSLRWARLAAHRGNPAPEARGFDESLRVEIPRLARGYDLVIIDTAGEFDDRLGAALSIADVALLPVKPEPSDIWVLRQSISVVRDVQKSRTRKPLTAMLALCCAERTRLSRSAALAVAEADLPAMRTVLRRSSKYGSAQNEGLGITTAYRNTEFADEMVSLLDELLALKGAHRAA